MPTIPRDRVTAETDAEKFDAAVQRANELLDAIAADKAKRKADRKADKEWEELVWRGLVR